MRRILDIRRHDFVRNADVRRITDQPPLSSIIKSRRLTFFGHLARMDENADVSQAIFEPPPENWRRPPGRPRTTWMKNIHDDLSSLDLGIHEARDLAQNRPLWRLVSLHSAGACCYWISCLHLLFTSPIRKKQRQTIISLRVFSLRYFLISYFAALLRYDTS